MHNFILDTDLDSVNKVFSYVDNTRMCNWFFFTRAREN